jgi:hypothetical protein
LPLSDKYTASGNTLYHLGRRVMDLERTPEDIAIDNAAANGQYGDPALVSVIPPAPPMAPS